MKFRNKPIWIEATRWFKVGDHPAVRCYSVSDPQRICPRCERAMADHGWVDNGAEGGDRACPGDWIVIATSSRGERCPRACKPEVFDRTYESLDEICSA